jgi:hypothetical protein
VGNRLFTRHAVDYFQPSGRRSVGNVPTAHGEGGGCLSQGRSIAPFFVEYVIINGTQEIEVREGHVRTVHRLGDLEVVTEQDAEIVVTISYRR